MFDLLQGICSPLEERFVRLDVMKAAVLHTPGNCSLEDIPTPEIGAGELLIRVEANTICGTDLRLIAGTKTAGVRPGVVLGHEFCGRVAEVGSGVSDFTVGQQVSVSPAVVCGTCPQCKAGMENLCSNLRLFGYEFDGGLAEYVRIPRDAMTHGRVVATEHEISPALLALAEPLSCCLNGLRQSPITPGMTVVIIGSGPIGLIHTALAASRGARVIVSGREGRLAPATALGATEVTSLTGEELRTYVMGATHGRGADLVMVCASATELAGQALTLVRPGGAVNYFAGFPAGAHAQIDPNIVHYKQVSILGSANARLDDHNEAVRLLSSGELDLSSLVTHVFALADFDAALEAVRTRAGLKIALSPTL